MKKKFYTVVLYCCFPICILIWFSIIPIAVFITIITDIFLYIKGVNKEKSFDIVFGIFLNILLIWIYLINKLLKKK